MRSEEQHKSGLFYELCYMIVHILKPIPDTFLISRPSSSRLPLNFFSQVSPAAFASLFLGVSLVLMLFGSITFIVGFILMPWVIGLVFLFYLAGFVSQLSNWLSPFLVPGICLPGIFHEAEAQKMVGVYKTRKKEIS